MFLCKLYPGENKVAQMNQLYWTNPDTTVDWLEHRSRIDESARGIFTALQAELPLRSAVLVAGFAGKTEELTFFQHNGHDVYGLEINQEFIDMFRRQGFPPSKLFNESITRFKFGDQRWNLIVVSDVLNWISPTKYAGVLKKLFIGLKPGGYLYIRWPEGNGYQPKNGPERYCFHILQQDLEALLVKAGFAKENIVIRKITDNIPNKGSFDKLDVIVRR